MAKFADNLRYARKRAGRTQVWMAEQLKIHRTTYTKYENGTTEPPLEMFRHIVNVLDVNPAELLG